MDEKPKSIWKKSWTGRRALPIWGALAGVTILLVVLIAALGKLDTPIGSTFQTVGIISIGIVTVSLIVIYILIPFFRWLFWKHWRRTLFALACFVTLIALFYAEEDWRGKHDWEKFKREWEAKGERFDWQSIVPPTVPDDQNFAFSPVWIAEVKYDFLTQPKKAESWYGDRIYSEEASKIFPLLPVTISAVVGTNFWKSGYYLSETPDRSGNWQTAQLLDLKPWQTYYRDLEKTNPAVEIPVAPQPQTPAQDVLLALGKFDPVIEQLRADSALPYSRFPLGYDGMPAAILLPHLSALKQFAQVLQLRAIAELQNGQTEKALADVKLSLRLADSIRTEPFLISHLVRIAILQIALQPVYEGLANHQWSNAQLADLNSELAKLDFLADYEFAIRGERALCIGNIEFFRHPHDQIFKRPHLYFMVPLLYLIQDMSNEGESSHMSFQMLALSFGPSGWIDQNELRIAQFETKWYLPIVDEDAKTISQAKIRAASNALGREIRHRTPENVLETLLMPSLGGAAEKFAYAQSITDLARVAIALERYRLAHGEFPESLDAIAAQFPNGIPHDIIGGQPLHYRRTDDGQFVLYSVGWDERDDGGIVGLLKSGGADINKGDWVWRYPQK
ncbi:MAG TPA: hypothetical protein VGH42_01795 [Verrucomicrobiae bacterium]|jgi:hypothetical protein